jgi:hypothetical protein
MDLYILIFVLESRQEGKTLKRMMASIPHI